MNANHLNPLLQGQIMLIGNYRIFNVIGEGSFSIVKFGTNLFTQEPVAVKIVPKQRLRNPEDLRWLQQEVEVMRRLDHPGIVKLLDFIEDESAFYMILEFCGGGELFDFIIKRTRVEEPLARWFFKQICLTIDYLHSQGIVHRDLKPENLLLSESRVVKLIDFGLCSTALDVPLTNRCGSPCYIAPETLVQSSYYGAPADVWALGVILYALVDGSLPWNYQDPNRMYEQITKGEFPMPQMISPACQDLLGSILDPNPVTRITIQGILTHPWLAGLGNVFPAPPRVVEEKIKEPRLHLGAGGFSENDLRPNIQLSEMRPSGLETIYEDGVQPPQMRPLPTGPVTRQKPAQPRAISLDMGAMGDGFGEDDGANEHRGVIISQTISHGDPKAVARQFEGILMSMGVKYRTISQLEFQLTDGDLHVNAEVCRVRGFRNLYVISFRRIKGDSWSYTQYVTSVINRMKKP